MRIYKTPSQGYYSGALSTQVDVRGQC